MAIGTVLMLVGLPRRRAVSSRVPKDLPAFGVSLLEVLKRQR
jgi:hypothetical protein